MTVRILGVTQDSKVALGVFNENTLIKIRIFEHYADYLMKSNRPYFIEVNQRNEYVSEDLSKRYSIGQTFPKDQIDSMIFNRAYDCSVHNIRDGIVQNVVFCFKCYMGYSSDDHNYIHIKNHYNKECEECSCPGLKESAS